MLGSCALHMCLVAAGCADAHFSQGISVWDIAAGYLVVQEAGGVIVDTGGRNCWLLLRMRTVWSALYSTLLANNGFVSGLVA